MVLETFETLGRWSKMTQKQLKDRLAATKADIAAIKQEIQRIPMLEKTVEKMHAMLVEMYED